jgi:DNA-binding MurR/RpiR family transcriptional regulator
VLAQLLLDDPSLPARLSISELAVLAGASTATVTRFSRHIGFSSYLALRVAAAGDQGRLSIARDWGGELGLSLESAEGAHEVLRALRASRIEMIHATSKLLDLETIDRVAAKIRRCRQADIYGVSGSAIAGRHAELGLYRLGVNARAWSDVHNGITSAALLDSDCVAIAVSNSGATPETIAMLATAKDHGACTVAVLSDMGSPLAQLAHECIQILPSESSERYGLMASQWIQTFALDFLCMSVVIQDQEQARRASELTAAAIAAHTDRHPLRRAAVSRRQTTRLDHSQ